MNDQQDKTTKRGFTWFWENRVIPTFWLGGMPWAVYEYTENFFFFLLMLAGLWFAWTWKSDTK